MLKKIMILSLLLQVIFVSEAFSQTKQSHYRKYHSKKYSAKRKSPVVAKINSQATEGKKARAEEPVNTNIDENKNTSINNQKGTVEPDATPTPTPQNTPEKINSERPITDLNPARIEVDKAENLGRDVQGGSVVVKVTSNGNASVRLGMASRGVTVIEFPYNDPIYKIYPGDENFVSIDCGARDKDNNCNNLATDSLVLRPGKLFNQWSSLDEDAATVVTVQRASGIVVSFIVVPVKSFSNHAFHVVCRYDLAEVITQRKSAGLPYNLNRKEQSVNPSLNTEKSPSGVEEDATLSKSSGFQNASFSPENVTSSGNPSDENDLETRTVAELKKVARSNVRLNFSKPVHGLSVAVATQDFRTSDEVIEVVAIRNVTDKPIRLVPDQPELFIESVNEKDKSAGITSERISILMQATTANDDDVLMPNEVYYFSFAYKMPILGAKQVVKLAFAQREAADEPSSVVLLGLNR